jgi:hypothetical protein
LGSFEVIVTKAVEAGGSGEGSKSKQGMETTLIDRITPKAFRDFAAAAVDFLKMNSVVEKFRHGKAVVVKTRNPGSEQIADSANLFFRLAGIPIRFCSKIDEWQQWEVESYRLLNGDAFRAFAVGNQSICVEKVPGRSVWDHMLAGTLTREIMQAAAKEFRRVHQLWSGHFRGPWSHGDATMQNVIYHAKTDRARLIDFEIMHEKSLPSAGRHADDLVVFLLDLVAKGHIRQWLPLAAAFLETYRDRDVLTEINQRLVIPNGLARIWWNVRTSFANAAKVKRRIERLRTAVAALQVSSTIGTERARSRRRPSTICQTIKPGIPSVSSRTLAISESAKAASPGMPRRLLTTR